MNKNLITYLLIFFLVIPIFGFNFLISLIGNILLLIFLIPLLIFLIVLISFKNLKSVDLNDINFKKPENFKKPSETTIEVKAEEVK